MAEEIPAVCVHILRHGNALCGIGPPGAWPEGHTWIGYGALPRRFAGVPVCVRCYARAQLEGAPVVEASKPEASAWSEHNGVHTREADGVIVHVWAEPQIEGHAVHVTVRAHETTRWDRSLLVRGSLEQAKAAGDVLQEAWASLIKRLEAIPGVIME